MNKKYILIAILFVGLLVSSIVLAQTTTTPTTPAKTSQIDDSGITYPIPELGNCANRDACRSYCNDSANMSACIDFASKHGLMNGNEASVAKKFAEEMRNKQTPGGCTGPESCNAYCQDINHLNECLSFAKEHGLSDDNIERGEHIQKFLAQGGKLPGGCTSKDSCESYCGDFSHATECAAFAKNAGFLKEIAEDQGMNEDQFRKVLDLTANGQAPGGCKSKDQCENYCKDNSHLSECLSFGVKAGFISEDQAEKIKEVGGKGPGGCNSESTCRAYCNDSTHMQECFKFGKDHNLISPEELKRAQEGIVQLKIGLDKAPPEIKACLNSVLGSDAISRIQAGTFVPSPEIGDRLQECADKFREDFHPEDALRDAPPAVAQCLKDKIGSLADKIISGQTAPDADTADAFRVCMGQNQIMREDFGEQGMPNVGEFLRGAPPEIQSCIKGKLGADFADKVANNEATRADIQGKLKDCLQNFRPQFRQSGEGLRGEAYHGIAPENGKCNPKWILETNNGRVYCAPTQAKCDEEYPGSVLTTDKFGFKVCWQKMDNSQPQQDSSSGEGRGYETQSIIGGTMPSGMMGGLPGKILECVKGKLSTEEYAQLSRGQFSSDAKDAIQSCATAGFGQGIMPQAPANSYPTSGHDIPPSGTIPPYETPPGTMPPAFQPER